jgi:CubicO group peptidase (beta-lactamase class C family)
MLTAVAIFQLVEADELDLEVPIQTYVPGFPEKQAPINCELLLKHQSGIRHYKPGEVASAIAYANTRDSFAVFEDDPLLFAPGQKYSYTTYGYNVLGAAIEGASGQNYVDYVHDHIFLPAGMKTIRADSPAAIIPHRAAGYRRRGSVLVNDLAVDVSNKIPAGGWCATPSDLARFAMSLMRGQLVSRETLETMWTPQKTAAGKQTDSGYGCFVRFVDGDRRISHSGGQPKVSTYLTMSPARKSAVAVMCNLRGARLAPLADALMKIVAKAEE